MCNVHKNKRGESANVSIDKENMLKMYGKESFVRLSIKDRNDKMIKVR